MKRKSVTGKTSKHTKKHISILIVPDGNDKIKTFNMSVLFKRIPIVFIPIFVLLVSLISYTSYVIYQNNLLKNNLASLEDINYSQSISINEKTDELKKLQDEKEETSELIDNYKKEYQEVTNNYLQSRSGDNMISRSGDRNDRSFLNDVDRLKGILNNLEEANDLEASNTDLTETAKKLKEYSDYIPTSWPAPGRITSQFGERKDPISFRTKYHSGLDFAATYGQNVLASAKGTVSFADYNGEYGYEVIIDHGHGLQTVYGHNSRLVVKQGQSVNKGSIIAKAGSTGKSTGPHVHFEVRLNGNCVDPFNYLDKDSRRTKNN